MAFKGFFTAYQQRKKLIKDTAQQIPTDKS